MSCREAGKPFECECPFCEGLGGFFLSSSRASSKRAFISRLSLKKSSSMQKNAVWRFRGSPAGLLDALRRLASMSVLSLMHSRRISSEVLCALSRLRCSAASIAYFTTMGSTMRLYSKSVRLGRVFVIFTMERSGWDGRCALGVRMNASSMGV